MTQDARKDWRDLCREAVAETNPARLIAIVNELNRELDEAQKKKAAVYLQQIDKGCKRESKFLCRRGWTDGCCPHSASRIL